MPPVMTQRRGLEMIELNTFETEQVNGGFIPMLIVIAVGAYGGGYAYGKATKSDDTPSDDTPSDSQPSCAPTC